MPNRVARNKRASPPRSSLSPLKCISFALKYAEGRLAQAPQRERPHPMTAGSHGGGRIIRTPKPCPYSDARSRLGVFAVSSSGAATPIPRYRQSAARVLMDEGWWQCNRGARGEEE